MMLARLIAVAMSCLTLVMSAWQIDSEWRFWVFKDLAGRLANGVNPTEEYWQRFDTIASQLKGVESDCNFYGVRARLMVALTEYDSAVRSHSMQEIDKRRAVAVQAANQNIRCAPLDGNAWFRSALLEVSAHGLTETAHDLFQNSDKFAPAEGALMQLRIPLYASYTEAGHAEYRDQVLRDITNYTRFGLDPNHAIVWCGGWPDLLCASVKDGLRYLTIRQRDWYFVVANNLGIDLGQPKKETIIVDPFSGQPINRDKRSH